MGIRMNPSLELLAPSGRSPEAVPTRPRASLVAWVRALPIQAILALGLVSSAAADLATPEEGEAQLLAMLNKDREVKLRPHRVLDVLADWQAAPMPGGTPSGSSTTWARTFPVPGDGPDREDHRQRDGRRVLFPDDARVWRLPHLRRHGRGGAGQAV